MKANNGSLRERFTRRARLGVFALGAGLVAVGSLWALAWSREAAAVRRDLDRYTREEALTLSRLLLYDLAADPRVARLRRLEEEMALMPSPAGEPAAELRDKLVPLIRDNAVLPDAQVWEAARRLGIQATLEDISRARRALYQQVLEDVTLSLQEELGARVAFSDHLRGLVVRSRGDMVDIRAGNVDALDGVLPEDKLSPAKAGGGLIVHLPLYVETRYWGDVWCILGREAFAAVSQRLQRSLAAGQWLLGAALSVFLAGWGWLWYALLRRLGQEVVEPVVSLAERMERWERQPPSEPPPSEDETARLVKAFEGLLERVRTQQEQIVKAERLGLLERVGAGLSHELNNALNPARLRLEEIRLSGREPQAEDVAALHDHLAAAQRILRDLGATTRRGEVAARPVGREEWLDVALRLVEPHFRETPRLDVRVPTEVPPVLGEPQRMIQCVVNLLLNARDAAAERGAEGAVALAVTAGEGHLLLEVSDNGRGISEEVKKRLFEPFVTTKQSGSGMGLFFVDSAARGLGGWVRLADTGHQGSRIELAFKLVPPAGAPDG